MLPIANRPRLSARDLTRTAYTIALAALGGIAANQIGVPLPWMIGAMLITTAFALFGLKPGGIEVRSPMEFRMIMVPVIGVMLGSSFTPAVLDQMWEWWITLVGLFVFVFAALLTIYALYRRVFGFDRPTAYFSAIPGGVIESALLGEQAGGDARTISLIHFCRILLAVLTIPIAMRILFGPVGSSAIKPEDLETALSLFDIVILIACGIFGLLVARALKVPGAPITGPMIASAIVHVAGWTSAHPPAVIVIAAQVVMGASLGARFAGYSMSQARLALSAAAVGMTVMLSLGILLAIGLRPFVDESFTAMILAYAPGGLAEMSLIALSLQIGVAFVAAHHVARIFIAMVFAPLGYRLFVDKTVKLQ